MDYKQKYIKYKTKYLEQEGVRHFIDLTQTGEKYITPFKTKYNYISYPIKDRTIPDNMISFCSFIINISNIIKTSKKDLVYINCRAGHGRSGTVVSAIICYLFNLSPYEGLCYTSKCHNNRVIMRDKWRKIGSPQTYQQKQFIYRLFQPINLNKIVKVNNHDFCLFDNSFNNIFDCLDFIKQNACIVDIQPFDDISIMRFIMTSIFNQDAELKDNLMNTYLRPIIAHIDNDVFWGIGKNNTGQNKLGIILGNIRLSYFQE
jgi:protein-tyrosine phosphatase